jgi:RHS repeat-associated protein
MASSSTIGSRSVHFSTRLYLFAVFSLLLSGGVMAQSTQTAAKPDRGITPNGAYSVSDLENISLQNGNLNLSIPLASLPAIAGGKLSWTISASYNSKLWDVIRQEQYGAGQGSGCQPIYTVDTSQASDRGGWRVGGSYAIYFRDAHDDVDYRYSSQTCEPTPQDYALLTGYRWYKVTLNTPDGAEHELRPTDYQPGYDGSREYLHNYYKDTPESINQPMRYYSFDGSYLSAVINPINSADPVRWTLYMPDGTTIVQYKNGIQRVRDTNANSIKIFTETDSSGNIVTHYQDEGTGREIRHVVIASASYSQRQEQVQYQTVGGAWESIDINFGTTNVHGKLYETDSWNAAEESTCRVTAEIGGGMGELPVIREIVYPVTEPGVSARQYTFSYNSDTDEAQAVSSQAHRACGAPAETYTRTVSRGMGELSRIVTPSGATAEYTYQYDSTHDFSLMGADSIAKDQITQKAFTHDGTTEIWTYDIKADFGSSTVTNPDGSVHKESFYSFNPAFSRGMAGVNGMGGLVYRTSNSDLVMTERHWTLLPFTGANEYSTGSTGQKVGFNPVVDYEYTTLLDGAGHALEMSARAFQYDYNGNLLQTTEYGWFDPIPPAGSRDAFGIPTGVPQGATALRVTNTDYYNSATSAGSGNVYAKRSLTTGAPMILNAPQQTTVGAATTRFSYDGQTYGTVPTIGNLTNLAKWDDVTNSWLSTATTYDSYGNVSTTTDPKGNATQVFYEDATHVMPTRVVVDPQNETGTQTSSMSYDFSTGAVLTKTDPNGAVSSIDYTNQLLGTIDPFGRSGAVYSPAVVVNGTSQRRKVTTIYEDHLRRVTIASDLNAEGDGLLKSRTTADQQGRSVLAEQSEDGSTYAISSETVYEQAGKYVFQSNPHRSTATSIDGWTRSTTDTLGRVIEVATFAGATRPAFDAACNATNNCTGKVTTAYDAFYTTVTDQAGKVRRSVTNGLGQLVRLDEPDSTGSLGGTSSPAQPTSYTYDVLGNLTQVRQGGQIQNGQYIGGQTRTFNYSSLSRLKSAINPESGTISYEYDSNGNLKKKIDPRLVESGAHLTIMYEYDGLNRVISRSYNDGTQAQSYADRTPTVTYAYDTLMNGKGRLASVSSSVSAYKYTGYDALGRVTASSQVTDGITYSMPEYKYNLAGALTSETYPSGRVISTGYDSAGRLSSVSGQMGTTSTPYASDFAYSAHGAVRDMKLGNGLYDHSAFNSRLQLTERDLGTTLGGVDKLKLEYYYGTTDNNGNVRSQTITVPGLSTPIAQIYAYDSLNRLQSMSETGGLSQSFDYDRYGNRIITGGFVQDTAHVPNTIQNNLTISDWYDQNTNRLKTENYDSAGNVVKDTVGTNPGNTFAYDAENKQIKYNGGAAADGADYKYDGDGRRVKKVIGVGQQTTIFVYDAIGQMVAEYDTNPPSGSGGASYFTEDNLGTPRIITGADQSVKARHDYLPSGEEIQANDADPNVLRKTAQKYIGSDDKVRQKFTSKERDNETGLDYFVARYYASAQGRFTSTDPVMLTKTHIVNPQRWNLYTYTANNPLNRLDPDGRDWFKVGKNWEWYDEKKHTYTDDKGKKHTITGVEYLIVFHKTGKNEYGATTGTLYFYKQNKLVASPNMAFSGGNGHPEVPNETYKIKLFIGKAESSKDLKPGNQDELKQFYGIQLIAPSIKDDKGEDGDYRWEWGSKRASMNEPDSNMPLEYRGNYIHGKEREGDWTHGCVCERNEQVLDALLLMAERKQASTVNMWVTNDFKPPQ